MPFVVKVTAPNGVVTWLSHPGLKDLRSLVPRVAAQEFATREAACAAIDSLPRDFVALGIWLSIEDTKHATPRQNPEPDSDGLPTSS